MDRKKKSFDAVEMVRKIRDRHYEETKDLTKEEQIAFYQKKARKLREKMDEREGQASV